MRNQSVIAVCLLSSSRYFRLDLQGTSLTCECCCTKSTCTLFRANNRLFMWKRPQTFDGCMRSDQKSGVDSHRCSKCLRWWNRNLTNWMYWMQDAKYSKFQTEWFNHLWQSNCINGSTLQVPNCPSATGNVPPIPVHLFPKWQIITLYKMQPNSGKCQQSKTEINAPSNLWMLWKSLLHYQQWSMANPKNVCITTKHFMPTARDSGGFLVFF